MAQLSSKFFRSQARKTKVFNYTNGIKCLTRLVYWIRCMFCLELGGWSENCDWLRRQARFPCTMPSIKSVRKNRSSCRSCTGYQSSSFFIAVDGSAKRNLKFPAVIRFPFSYHLSGIAIPLRLSCKHLRVIIIVTPVVWMEAEFIARSRLSSSIYCESRKTTHVSCPHSHDAPKVGLFRGGMMSTNFVSGSDVQIICLRPPLLLGAEKLSPCRVIIWLMNARYAALASSWPRKVSKKGKNVSAWKPKPT